MSKVYYRRHGATYECERAENDSDKRVIICLDEPIDGIILINGEKSCALTAGIGIFEEGVLEDGIQRPKLIRKSFMIEMEAFQVGTGVTTLLRSEEYIRGLYLEIKAQEGAIERLTARVLALEEKIVGKPIF